MQKIKIRYFLIAAFILTVTALSMFAYGETPEPSIPETTWGNNADISWYKSSGDIRYSTEREYNITTAEQLAGLAVLCNKGVMFSSYINSSGEVSRPNIVINIKNDIDLSAHKWLPIGLYGKVSIGGAEVERYFGGTFNGHGKKISGVIVSETTDEVGFFGKTGDGAQIVNVILDSVYVHSTGSKTGGLIGHGGMTGGAFDTRGYGTTLDNCIVSGYVAGKDAGGIIGQNNSGTIRHCVNMAEVVGSNSAGGIIPGVGWSTTIAHCVNMGDISRKDNSIANTYAGGIVGDYTGQYCTMIYCANVGKSDGGALIGHLQVSGGLSQCYWLTGTATNSLQKNETDATDATMGLKSYAALADIPAVAALLDEVPYSLRGSNYSPYFSGGIFTVTPTLYPVGSKYAETANITAKCDFDTYVENFISKGIIPAKGASTKIYVEKIDSHGQAYLIMKSGVEGNPVEILRAPGGVNEPTIGVYTTSVIEQSISLDKTALSLDVAGTSSDTLTASLYPTAATSKDITWNTGDANIASVTPKGSNNSQCNIQAVGGGATTITATSANGLIASCTVTVKGKPTSVTGVTLSRKTLSMRTGESALITAAVAPEGVDQSVTWSSDTPTAAKVDKGTVTAVAAGSAVITATSAADPSKSASCTVTVSAVPEAKPEKPVIDDTVKTPTSVDIEHTPKVYSDANSAAAALSSDITSSDLEVSAGGKVYITGAKANEIIKASLAGETLEKSESLPIFTISSDKEVVACSWKVKGALLLAERADAVDIRKIVSAKQTLKFEYSVNAANYGDGKFTILTSDGKIASGTIDTAADYQILLFIKDGGSYDLDSVNGKVTDPAVIVKTSSPAPSGGSSGSCNAGFGAAVLLTLLPLVLRRKK